MQNGSVASGILTQNSNWAPSYIFNFQRLVEICIKGIKERYAEGIISLSILKGSVHIKQNRLGKNEMWVSLLDF